MFLQNSSLLTFSLIAAFLLLTACSESGWTRQFGTSESDSATLALGSSVGPSAVYIAGTTQGVLPGQTGTGGQDAFVRKYDTDGNEVWTRQFGSSKFDIARGISVDSTGVYVAGQTIGALHGQTSTGQGDAFVRKYDADGNEVWTRQFGTPGQDTANAISVDATGVYVVGTMNTNLQVLAGDEVAFVRKYDTDGNLVWTREFGNRQIGARSVSVDATGVYVVGTTRDTLPGHTNKTDQDAFQDAFVRKYDADGIEVWTRQFSIWVESAAFANGISVDSTGVYVAGTAIRRVRGGGEVENSDAFVRKYDADGNEVWTRQIGTPDVVSNFHPESDGAGAISIDATGVYVAGTTVGTLPGQTRIGGQDAFVRKYDADGNEVWTRQFGVPGSKLNSSKFSKPTGISVGPSGVYVVGHTNGVLPGQTATGRRDAFIRQYDAEGN